MNPQPTTDVFALLALGLCALCGLALLVAGAVLVAFTRSAGRGLLPLLVSVFSARGKAEAPPQPPAAVQPNLRALAHDGDFEARLAQKIAAQQSSAQGNAPPPPVPPLQGPPSFTPRELPGARTRGGPPPTGDDVIAGMSDDLGL